MRKIFLITSMFLVCLLAVSVSASVQGTVIGGVVYQGNVSNGVKGAFVDAVCYNGVQLTYSNATSGTSGLYAIFFSEDDCRHGDSVNVTASYESLVGAKQVEWIADDQLQAFLDIELDMGGANIPLVPEFGFVVGMLTILSAVGIFFVVRKD